MASREKSEMTLVRLIGELIYWQQEPFKIQIMVGQSVGEPEASRQAERDTENGGYDMLF